MNKFSVPVPVASGSFAKHAPSAPKLTILLASLPGDMKGVEIALTIPLDPSQPDEERVIGEFGGDTSLFLKYQVEIDLQAERNQLINTIRGAYRSGALGKKLRTQSQLTHDELRLFLGPIATQGYSVYSRLFEKISPLNFSPDDKILLQNAVCSAFRRPQLLWIEWLLGPVYFFPWNFLFDEGFDEDNLKTLNPRRFWGFSHQIGEDTPQKSSRVLLPSPKTLSVTAAICSKEDPNDAHQRGCFQSGTQWLTSKAQVLQSLGEFQSDVFYFFGHHSQKTPPTPTTSKLTLNDSHLTVHDLSTKNAPQFSKDPTLVFLNGCHTAPVFQWSKDVFMGHFYGQGACRVCGIFTVAEVPPHLALEFAVLFWDFFLKGEFIASALQKARLHLLGTPNYNPLGLLYTLYGRIETRITYNLVGGL